jgi:hypothetical protein
MGGEQGGIASASMACKGAPQHVTLMVNEVMLGKFKGAFTGVTWAAAAVSSCLLTFTGRTQAKLVNSNVQGVRADLVPGMRHILCVAGDSVVQLVNSHITMGHGTGLAAFDRAHVTLHAGSIDSNTVKLSCGAGIRLQDQSTGRITGNCTVRDNTAQNAPGGGICVLGNASLRVDGISVITGNRAQDGGGVFVSGSANLTVDECSNIAKILPTAPATLLRLGTGPGCWQSRTQLLF